MEIALRDGAVFQRDFTVKRRCQTVDNSALHLRFKPIGINRKARIRRAGDMKNFGIAAAHIDGDNLRADCRKTFDDRDPAGLSIR